MILHSTQLFLNGIKLLLISALTFTLIPHKAEATHVMGSDIVWKCIGNHRYEVTLKFYRDCAGIGFSGSKSMQFNCVRGGTGSTSINLPRTSWKDITPACEAASNPCGNPGNEGFAGAGVEEHLYSSVIDFNSGQLKAMRDAGCCRFKMAFTECCRNIAITTGGANAVYYTDAEIDICNIDNSIKKGCDDSPDLRNVPISYLCCNQTFYFNNGVVDIDGDSLYFSLVASQSAQNTSVNYNSPFNPTTWPMTGYCRGSSGPCNCRPRRPVEGFCFDPHTGNITFLPIDCQEVGILVIKIEQFRLDSNANDWLYIGYTMRDIQLQVVNCSDNNPPELSEMQKPTICEGERICVNIKAEDEEYTGSSGVQSWKDTIDFTWNQGLPGATFEVGDPYFVSNQGITHAVREVKICWQTQLGDGREAPYLFAVTARDRACPRNAVSSRGYAIQVRRAPFADRIYTPGDCGRLAMQSMPHDSFWYKGTYQHLWEIRDSTNEGEPLFSSNLQTDSFQFLEEGKYIITYTVFNPPFNCPSEYSDTILITLDSFPGIAENFLGADISWCENIDTSVNLVAPGGYRYLWNTNDTSQSISVNQAGEYWVRVIGENGCFISDTLSITVDSVPNINSNFLGTDISWCENLDTSVNLIAPGGYSYLWNTNDTVNEISTNQVGTYWVHVIGENGCFVSDTLSITLDSVPNINSSFLGTDLSWCENLDTSVNLIAPGGYNYLWNTDETTHQISTNQAGTYWVHVIGENGCFVPIHFQ